ncbi:helix-turn-helix domain-containing protein [Roseateles sp.]|uniref:AraC family transcriptional regulator n=1 Tax=Roseateles sp. TaxID=1971397 RepID=UPI003BAD8173
MVRFGPWSTTLGLGALFALAVAAALLADPAQRRANRWVAALLGVMALKLTPYVIGYAGFYDAWPWLSFAPLDHELAFGPLLWLHVQQRTRERLPRHWAWHLLPAGLAALYFGTCFVQPLAWKTAWDADVHARFIAPALTAAGLASLAVYLALAWRRYRGFQAWLSQHVSNADEHRYDGLAGTLVALALLLAVSLPYEAATAIWHLNYFDRFGLYLALTLIVFALGLEAWRHAGRRHPLQPDAVAAPPAPAPRPPTDWAALGQAWRERTEREAWFRDPELGLDRLARLLGTNTSYLSRAFNEGLGQGFSDVIGALRVAWLQQRLADGATDELLDLALQAGFSSKTSFNRVFKAQTGMTPSAWRARS